jgi:glutathione S-transferase
MALGWIAAAGGAGALGWYAWERGHRRTYAVEPGLHREIALPHTQEFELYHNALSLCSKKTRLCLAELGIEYASHPVDLIETGSYQTLSRDFLRVNPAGTVPVLVHEGHPIYESHEQIRHAADHAGRAHSLLPEDPDLRAEMERFIDRSSLTGDDPTKAMEASAGNAIPGLTVPLFAAMISEIGYAKILEGLLFHRLKQRPLIFLGLKQRGLTRLHQLAPAMAVLSRSIVHMGRHLDALEEQLGKTGGPWILGESFSLADVSFAVIFDRLREADSLHVFLTDARPACGRYWNDLRARPSYAAAIEAHEHPSVVAGLRRLRATKARIPELRAALEGE